MIRDVKTEDVENCISMIELVKEALPENVIMLVDLLMQKN